MSEALRTDIPERKVELRAAAEWTCDDCGRSHFERLVSRPADQEEYRQHLVEIGELDSWQELPEGWGGEIVAMPLGVQCPDCGAEFGTISPSDMTPTEDDE